MEINARLVFSRSFTTRERKAIERAVAALARSAELAAKICPTVTIHYGDSSLRPCLDAQELEIPPPTLPFGANRLHILRREPWVGERAQRIVEVQRCRHFPDPEP